MRTRPLHRLLAAGRATAQTLRRRLAAATRPATAPLVAGSLADLARTKPELFAEHALLRQQLIALQRRVTRPRCTAADRALLVLLASLCWLVCSSMPDPCHMATRAPRHSADAHASQHKVRATVT